MWGLLSCWLVCLGAIVSARQLICPGCDNLIDAIDRYCPECGGTPLIPGGLFKTPECTVCGKKLRFGKSRSFRIRACTHCGVMLDEQGL